jgi:hypothetical protein
MTATADPAPPMLLARPRTAQIFPGGRRRGWVVWNGGATRQPELGFQDLAREEDREMEKMQSSTEGVEEMQGDMRVVLSTMGSIGWRGNRSGNERHQRGHGAA